MEKVLRISVIFSIVGAILFTVAVFVFWLPSLQSYVAELAQELSWLSQLVYPLAVLIAALCIGSLSIALSFPESMHKDEIFSNLTASKLSLISLLIALTGAVTAVAAVMLFAIGDRLLFFALLIIAAISLLIAFMLNVLSNYVKRAALLKEEVDATL